MIQDRQRKVVEILEAALEYEGVARGEFIERASGSDPSLRDEVWSLIDHDDKAESFMEGPVVNFMSEEPDGDRPELPEGRLIGPYRIIRRLGEGGMGVVYLARHTKLDRLVALKLLPEQFTQDRDRVRRFEQEARAASKLQHANIITIHDIAEADGLHYMVTEYIEGDTLREHMGGGPMKVEGVLGIMEQVASALKAAHEAGIVHRDIKPENIMIRSDGAVKVLDFGLAKLAEPSTGDSKAETLFHTRPGVLMGTPNYMSPEQVAGKMTDGRSDLFALGAVLYECLTGELAFKGASFLAVWDQIQHADPPPPSLRVPALPREFDRVTLKLLTKKPEGRYQSADDLIVDFKRLVGRGRGVPWPRLLGMLLVAAAGLFAYNYFLGANRDAPVARSAPKLGPVNLTNSGTAILGAVSPDGRYITYVQESGESQMLAVRGVNTGDSVTLAQPGHFDYVGLTFSPDGDYVYYVRYEGADVGQLYQTPLIGGGAKRVLWGVDSPVSFSPDGRSIAFVRLDKEGGEHKLLIAGADGTGERVVATRRRGERFSAMGAAWSPGGRSLIYGVGSWEGGFHTDLVELSLVDGSEKAVASQRWYSVWQLAWRGESDLLVSASVSSIGPNQIWKVSYPQGAVERVTNDLNDYIGLSISGDDGVLVTVQNNRTKTIWVGPRDDARQERQIATAAGASYGIAWSPDDRIIFSSMAGSNLNLSAINVDGSGRKQLTTGAGDNYHPSVSRDGRFIVFSSNRGGGFNIWRMNAKDGSQPTQLTGGGGDFYPHCSPDGGWVYYENQGNGMSSIWRVPMSGGTPYRLTEKYAGVPVVSPDGRLVACRYYIDGETKGIAILPSAGGEPLKLLPIPVINWQRVRWTPDGRALTYVAVRGGVYNLWRQPLDGGSPSQLTELKGEAIFSYDWSPDFKLLACERGIEISDVVMLGGR